MTQKLLAFVFPFCSSFTTLKSLIKNVTLMVLCQALENNMRGKKENNGLRISMKVRNINSNWSRMWHLKGIMVKKKRKSINSEVRKTWVWGPKWQPTPVFLPGESHGHKSLESPVHGVTKSRTRLNDQHFHVQSGQVKPRKTHTSRLSNRSSNGKGSDSISNTTWTKIILRRKSQTLKGESVGCGRNSVSQLQNLPSIFHLSV